MVDARSRESVQEATTHLNRAAMLAGSAMFLLFILTVLASFFIGPFPMALVFNGFEIGAIFLAIIIANEVTQRGESTWYEGLQLLAVYAVFGLTFYFV